MSRKQHLNDTNNHGPTPHSVLKSNEEAALDRASKGEVRRIPRTVVRITGFRVNPLDPDNFAGSCKDLIDGLRHAGLLHGDEWDKIKFEPDQEQVAHYCEEKTEIEIIYPETEEIV